MTLAQSLPRCTMIACDILNSGGEGMMKSKAKRTAAKKRLKAKHKHTPKSSRAATRRRGKRRAKRAVAATA